MHSPIWTQPVTRPTALKDSAICRIMHLAGAVDPDALAHGRTLLQDAGLRVVWDPGAHAPFHYLAASDDQRQREALRALRTPHVGAWICARGGYGTMRLLDELPTIDHPQYAPWLVGYSDITALHLWFNAQGIATIHGPMVAGLPKHHAAGGEELSRLIRMLRTAQPTGFRGLRRVHPGRARGRLIGGNLSLLQAMIGTPWLPTLEGAILLIEEVGEPAYRVDRMLQSLALGGRAQGLRGIVFGELTNCRGLDAKILPDWLDQWTKIFECPVAMNLPVGHGTTNLPIMLGEDYVLDADAGTLLPEFVSKAEAMQNNDESSPPPSRTTDANIIDVPAEEPPMGAGPMPSTSTAPGRLVHLLTAMLDLGVCTGLQLVASIDGIVTHNLSMGATAATPDAAIAPITPFTQFDLASVSKAISTAIVCHQLIDEGVWSLDDRIPQDLHPSGMTLGQLLSHRSGLPAWKRLYDDARQQAEPRPWLRKELRELALESSPDTQCVYSDPGYILLGWWLEAITQTPLDALFDERIRTPLGLQRTGYRRSPPSIDARERYAATEFCPWRGRVLQGIVHDEHCQILGGVSGHAGLFSTASEVDAICRALLQPASPLLSKQATQRMWSKPANLCDGAYTYGWDTITATPSNAGSHMDRQTTVGHLGYAGTSIWIDHHQKIAITLLTNRVHPTRENQTIRIFRPTIYDAVMEDLRAGI